MITQELVEKVRGLVGHGLSLGLGVPKPGRMCVEAVVCYALGEPHGDCPSCVGSAVRKWNIMLNDASWSSNAARAAGLRDLAIAQLGSNQIDQVEFASRLVLATVNRLLPETLVDFPGYATYATACSEAKTLNEATQAAWAAAWATRATAAARGAAAQAARAARAAAWAARAAEAARAADAAEAAEAAAEAAWAAAKAAAWATAAEAADRILRLAAGIGLDVLIEMKSPGTKFLEGK